MYLSINQEWGVSQKPQVVSGSGLGCSARKEDTSALGAVFAEWDGCVLVWQDSWDSQEPEWPNFWGVAETIRWFLKQEF